MLNGADRARRKSALVKSVSLRSAPEKSALRKSDPEKLSP